MSRKDEIIFRRKDGRREARYVKLSGKRKETIERVFADAKEKHAMRYTHHQYRCR